MMIQQRILEILEYMSKVSNMKKSKFQKLRKKIRIQIFYQIQKMENILLEKGDPSKDIKRDIFRYRDKTALARIEQYLKDHTQSQVVNMKIDHKNIINKENFSEGMSALERRVYLSRLIAKNLLPSLHNKTHFQAAQTMFNNLPSTLMENTRSQPQLHTQEEKRKKQPLQSSEKQRLMSQEAPVRLEDIVSEKDKKQGNEMDPVETSKMILKKCNVVKEKNPKVSTLHQGSGHLISTMDLSISKVYRELYHVDFKRQN